MRQAQRILGAHAAVSHLFNLGKHRGYGDTFFIDEEFVKINGKQNYLWRAVDQNGKVVDIFLPGKRDDAAAKRFFKRLSRSYGADLGMLEKLVSVGEYPYYLSMRYNLGKAAESTADT